MFNRNVAGEGSTLPDASTALTWKILVVLRLVSESVIEDSADSSDIDGFVHEVNSICSGILEDQ